MQCYARLGKLRPVLHQALESNCSILISIPHFNSNPYKTMYSEELVDLLNVIICMKSYHAVKFNTVKTNALFRHQMFAAILPLFSNKG
jgi:hypothetical protein